VKIAFATWLSLMFLARLLIPARESTPPYERIPQLARWVVAAVIAAGSMIFGAAFFWLWAWALT
jgi:hypothetical protein